MPRLRGLPFGRLLGIFFTIVGSIGVAVLLIVDWKARRYVSRTIVMSPALLSIGLAMLSFPGANISTQEVDQGQLAVWWSTTPRSHLGLWVVAAILGVVVSLFGSHYLVGL